MSTVVTSKNIVCVSLPEYENLGFGCPNLRSGLAQVRTAKREDEYICSQSCLCAIKSNGSCPLLQSELVNLTCSDPLTGKKSPEYWAKMLSDVGKEGYKNPFFPKLTQDFGDVIRENDFRKYPPGSININTNYINYFS